MSGLVTNLDALDATEPYDVCIVGSGVAGSILGTRLVAAGLRVLMLEAGGSLRHWLFDQRVRRMAEYETSGATNYPPGTRTAGRLVGGNSNFWTGRAERFQPSDFEANPYTPKDNPWPIRYADLEPHYARAEETLRVRGGALSDHMPPRDQPLPHPPQTDITPLKKLLQPTGVVVDDSPTATPAKGVRFFRMTREILPEFLRSRTGTLVSGVSVTRLVHDDDGRITGAVCRTLDGAEKIARARVYVVACGGIQTPRLLLLSRSERFPDGLGNEHDRVGRSFNEHPAVNIYAEIAHNRFTIWARHKIGRTHHVYDRFRAEGLGAIHPVFIQSYLFPHHLVTYRLRDVPEHLRRIAARVLKATIYMGCQIEMKPVDANRVTLSATRRDAFGDPIAHLVLDYTPEDLLLLEKARALLHSWFDSLGATNRREIEITWARHHIGTCRMGADPRTSVCDPDLRVHACPNLYLGGCETFPTGSGLPPVLTIAALAHRLGDHLVERLQAGIELELSQGRPLKAPPSVAAAAATAHAAAALNRT